MQAALRLPPVGDEESGRAKGVIGHVGTVLGRNNINIANFSLGRREGTSEAVALVSTDGLVPESVLAQLKRTPRSEFWRAAY